MSSYVSVGFGTTERDSSHVAIAVILKRYRRRPPVAVIAIAYRADWKMRRIGSRRDRSYRVAGQRYASQPISFGRCVRTVPPDRLRTSSKEKLQSDKCCLASRISSRLRV